jgi:hypothetical protein
MTKQMIEATKISKEGKHHIAHIPILNTII